MSTKKKPKEELYIKQSVSLSPEMIETMKQIAKQERRSLSNMMQIATEFYLKHKDDHIMQARAASPDRYPEEGLTAAETKIQYSRTHSGEQPSSEARVLEIDMEAGTSELLKYHSRLPRTAQRRTPEQKRPRLIDTLKHKPH